MLLNLWEYWEGAVPEEGTEVPPLLHALPSASLPLIVSLAINWLTSKCFPEFSLTNYRTQEEGGWNHQF